MAADDTGSNITPQSSPLPVAHASHSSARRRWRRFLFGVAAAAVLVFLLLIAGALVGRHWLRKAVYDSLPQVSGSIALHGLSAPVSIHRDSRGVPSIHARSFDDLVFAQGFVTAQDRLFQMDTLRRHAAGELAEILGSRLVAHDRSQRVLSLGPAADRILAQLPPDQRLAFDRYAAGVNASMALQSAHLPVEFRVLAYQPRPWTARDSVLVSLILFEDLTNSFPRKLDRETLTARLAQNTSPDLLPQLLADLYPVGSWRDHPPSQPAADVTAPLDSIPEIPLDDTQVRLDQPVASPETLRVLRASLASPFTQAAPCGACRAGSNNWAVAGMHTASGMPILSNDMHLSLTAPGIWYAVDLASDTGPNPATSANAPDAPSSPDVPKIPDAQGRPFHAAGVSLPGVPYIVSGHNDHVAWGFTNLGADVQDLYVEHLRGSGIAAEFRTASGTWQPLTRRSEQIRVRGGTTINLVVEATEHGGVATPILTPILPADQRTLALHWSLFDTAGFSLPFAAVNAAANGPALVTAFAGYTGPTQNLVYADSSGHIGYHAIGRIPIRGQISSPAALAPVPIDTAAPDAVNHEWVGFVPYDQLPATVDPAGGVLATANSRITPDNYPFPVTLDWAAPYRTERIWHLLTGTHGLQPRDMLRIQTDVYSESDKLIAHRFAYAIDHTPAASPQLRRAADVLRGWDGEVLANTPAPAIVAASRSALWTLLLTPKLGPGHVARRPGTSNADTPATLNDLYSWGERDIAEEQIIAHLPGRWLPASVGSWDELFSAAVNAGLKVLHAPSDPGKLRYGHDEPSQMELPLFAQSVILRHLIGMPTGTPDLTLSGNGRTVRQTHRDFGPSERLTVNLADPASATLVIPLGESGNPSSGHFLDQLSAWLGGSSFPLPFGAPMDQTGNLILLPN